MTKSALSKIVLIALGLGFMAEIILNNTRPMRIANDSLAATLDWSFGDIGIPLWIRHHVDHPLSWLLVALLIALIVGALLDIVWQCMWTASRLIRRH